MSFFIGLISGTSADAIDAALVSFDGENSYLEHYKEFSYPDQITNQISSIRFSAASMRLDHLSSLHAEIGHLLATAANKLITSAKIERKEISAIGSHGQTIFHAPDAPFPFSMQIGDPNKIAAETGITTIADFRNMDLAFGGEGAPLVAGFHQALFRVKDKTRVILNLGGIANITLLPTAEEQPVIGFDTGPANALMDEWTVEHLHKPFDENGEWGKAGNVIPELLSRMLEDPFFQKAYPKSTGREYFNMKWLKECLQGKSYPAENVQATLQGLTVETVAIEVENLNTVCHELIVCGGGASNAHVMNLLANRLKNIRVNPSSFYNISPDCIEAMAFAWLAKRRLAEQPGNIPTVTGARKKVVLGGVYLAR